MEPAEERSHKMQSLRQGANTGLVVFLGWVFWQGSTNLFQWHPILMAVGYIGFMVEGICIGRKLGACRGVVERQGEVERHVYFCVLCAVMVVMGWAVVYKSKEVKGKAHMTSWHGTVGVCAVSCLLFQLLLGFSLYYPLPFPKTLKPYLRTAHLFVALFTSLLGTVSLSLGLLTTYASQRISPTARVAVGIGSVCLHVAAFFES
eukprot:TRINITY_DN31220_c0_g1_i1.p1 TRINITY_DN31220_c0_g1~~TRINITY_DN31220_c0_g1_i1.p1  ORF type:complete len:215 (+),score=11.37 TRINITY_DN31220_c0_g1_i1:36-647(+)